MNAVGVGPEADFDDSSSSESMFGSSSSSSSEAEAASFWTQDISSSSSSKGGTELRRKMKKLRSIKLAKLPSVKLVTRQTRIQSEEESTPAKMSDAAPNYMKTTTSSDAKKETLQKPGRTLIKRSSFKPARSLARLSSSKFRRSFTRRAPGGFDLKKKLKKSRSIRYSDGSIALSQASSRNSLSSSKSSTVLRRTPTLRPARVLTKVVSLRTKRPSMKQCSLFEDSSSNRATCSSTLKGSNFSDHVKLQPGGDESEGISAMKVCPYTYCSLHGHKHSTLPPLKRFVSMRRRQLKAQKSIKLERQSHRRASSTSTKKRISSTRKMPATNTSDGTVSNFNEEIQVCREVHQEVSQSLASTSTSITDHPFDESGTMLCNQLVESTIPNNDASFASPSEPTDRCDPATEVDNENSANNSEFPVADSEADSTTDVDNTPRGKEQHMGLWHLIYQHMVSGIDVEVDPLQPHDVEDGEDREEDRDVMTGDKDLSQTNQSMGVEDHERGSPNIQFYEYNAIKLVQEAFDKILSEIPDQPSDETSISGSTNAGKEISENSYGESEELKISMYPDLDIENTAQEQEKMTLVADDSDASVGERAEATAESKSNQQTPKGWSNLKKIITLKRFVKAIEKVRNLNPRKPRFLPVKPESEVEKVLLHSRNTEGRKNSDEWMLDHALQQVISTLAPAQKRKVALLVQAFETVIPEVGTHPKSVAAASPRGTPVQRCNGSQDQKVSGKGEDINFGISLQKTPCQNFDFQKNQEQVSNFYTAEMHSLVSCFDTKEAIVECNVAEKDLFTLETTSRDIEVTASLHENGQDNVIPTGVQVDFADHLVVQISEPKLCDQSFPMPGDAQKTLETSDLTSMAHKPFDESKSLTSISLMESKATNKLVDFASINEPAEEADEESNIYFAHNCEDLTNDGSTAETPMEKQKHMGLWYLIYQHMASGIAVEDGTLQQQDVADNQEQGGKNSNITGDDHDGSSSIQSYQHNAIKLVREAFDKILSEIPDQSADDDKSVNSDVLTDKEVAESSNGEDVELNISASSASDKDDDLEYPEGMRLNANNISAFKGEKAEVNVECKSNHKTPKSWNNLRKIVLLKRFVKTLEQVRKINPRKPQYLPVKLGPEAEKVHLRHPNMVSRKNSEEWMLDNVLQQVISTLAPAQKRKVALLVQAFESVLPEIGTHPNAAASPHATPIQSSHSLHREGSGSNEGEETNFRSSLCKTPCLDLDTNEKEQVGNFYTAAGTPVYCSDIREATSGCNVAKTDTFELPEPEICVQSSPAASDVQTASREEFLVHEEVPQEVPKERMCTLEVHDHDCAMAKQTLELKCEINEPSEESGEARSQIIANNNAISSASTTEMERESSEATGGEIKIENKFLRQRFALLQESISRSTSGVAHEQQLEKQKNMGLWYLIYKHMALGTASVLEEADKDDQSTLIILKDAPHDRSNLENHNADRKAIELQQIEAIRMVEEAIDEIPLPGNQDELADDQSVDNKDHEQQEQLINFNNATNDDKAETATTGGNEPKLSTQKSWSNLKKLILLKRFVKALEKVKRITPREPRFLPLDPNQEAEKVNLKHQIVGDGKNTDEWMLDHTLQQVVAKLTPARKRKVQLLVEAFETVIPTIGG